MLDLNENNSDDILSYHINSIRNVSINNIDLHIIRELAKEMNLIEVCHYGISNIISFVNQHRNYRINIYYTTNTVQTIHEHVIHNNHHDSIIFRNHCTMDELLTIFQNPDIHTGYGYYKQPKTMFKQGIMKRYELLSKPSNEINDLLLYIHNTENNLIHTKNILKERLLEREVSLKLQSEQEEAILNVDNIALNQRKKEELIYKRGQFCKYKLQYSDHFPNKQDSMDECKCIAIADGGYVAIMNDGSCRYHNIPDPLYQLIKKYNNENIEYIALGDDDQYYVRTTDGHYEISEACKSSFGEDLEHIINYSSVPILIAFGPIGIYYIKYVDGYSISKGIYSKLYYLCKYTNVISVWIGRNDTYVVTYYDSNDQYQISYSNTGILYDVKQFIIKNIDRYEIKQLLISKQNDQLHSYIIRYNEIS